MAGKARPSSVEALKKQVNTAWRNMDPEDICSACRGFRPRLQRCIAAEGSYIISYAISKIWLFWLIIF